MINQQILRFRLNPNGQNLYDFCMHIGVVGIGWPKTGDVSGLNKNELITKLREAYPEENFNNRQIGLIAGYFTRLINMKVGDYVLISAPNNNVTIAQVTKPYKFNEKYIYKDIAHQVSIKQIKTVPMATFDIKLKKSIDAANTIIMIHDTKMIEDLRKIAENPEQIPLVISDISFRKFKIQKSEKKIIELSITSNITKKDLYSMIDAIEF